MTAVTAPATRSGWTGARIASTALLAAQILVVVAYLALVVAPFLAHDLHNMPEEQVAGGMFDPKGLWPEPIAPVMSIMATLTWVYSAIYAVLVMLATIVTGAMGWRTLKLAGYARIIATLVLGAAFVWFQGATDTGALLAAWMAD